MPRRRIRQVQLQIAHHGGLERFVRHRKTGFHAVEEIAPHPVRAGEIHARLTTTLEVEHPRVLKEPPDHGGDANVVGHPLHAGPQCAHAAHHQVDGDAGLRRAIQRLDDLRLHQRVHLGDHPRRPPRLGLFHFRADVFQDGAVQRERRLQHLLQAPRAAHGGELLEDALHVLADVRIAGEQPVIRV